MKKPFDLSYYYAHPDCKVETRNGLNAEFVGFRGDDMICWVSGAYRSYNHDGTIIDRDYSHYDLFIVTDKPEFGVFGNHIKELIEAYNKGKADALKEFESKCKFSSDIEHGYVYGLGFKAGKEDALKDLPRWEKSNALNTRQTIVVAGYTKDKDELYHNGNIISIKDLEKLPGFKDE